MKMKKNNLIFLSTCALAIFTSGSIVLASQSVGTINDSYKMTKICKNADCSSYGNINWKPTLNSSTAGATAVSITDTAVSGYIWGDEIGWVNLQPAGSGVTVNSNTGVLSGSAYATVGSWINFAPTTAPGGTAVGVSINSSGQFTGWAYVSGINGGWMKFDCSSSATCITTDWRPTGARTYSSSGSGSRLNSTQLAALTGSTNSSSQTTGAADQSNVVNEQTAVVQNTGINNGLNGGASANGSQNSIHGNNSSSTAPTIQGNVNDTNSVNSARLIYKSPIFLAIVSVVLLVILILIARMALI